MRLQDTIKESWVFLTEAKDCESAYNVITNPESGFYLRHGKEIIYSGEDLAKLLLEYMPNCKIILLTIHWVFKDKTIIKI
jgi:hypothetical protein